MAQLPNRAFSSHPTPLAVRILAFFMGVWLGVALLLGIIWLAGCTPWVMGNLMTDTAPNHGADLPRADYAAIAGHVAAYLRGRTTDFQLILHDTPLFIPREISHMADVQGLFRLAVQVLGWGIGGFLLLAIFLHGRGIGRYVRNGLWALLGVVAMVGMVMLVDFQAFFLPFHHLLFTNDLWILHPAESLLVRLMNAAFFTRLSIGIVLTWCTACLGVLLFTRRRTICAFRSQ